MNIPLLPGISVRIIATATAESTWRDVQKVRENLLRENDPIGLPNSLLKHADEQTWVGLSALHSAVKSTGQPRSAFADWGVIGWSNHPGRRRMIDSIARYADRGAWGVTPHFIPHCLIHSFSGLATQAFQFLGPNLGVGGNPGTENDVAMTAAAWLAGGDVPGVWCVWLGWDCGVGDEDVCRATAVGLTAADASPSSDADDHSTELYVRLRTIAGTSSGANAEAAHGATV